MTFRFSEGLLAVDISISADTLSILLTKDGVKQVQYNFFKIDPRSYAAREMERLCRDLRRDGCHLLAERVDLALLLCQNAWYDPVTAYDSMLSVLSDLEPLKQGFGSTRTDPLFN